MKLSSSLACLLEFTVLLAPFGASADEVRHTTIPGALRERWAPSADDCHGDKSAIVLAANHYTAPGHDCGVDWVVETAGAGGTIYSAHLSCTGADGQRAASNLILKPNGADQVLVGDTFGSLKPYLRCPADAANTKD